MILFVAIFGGFVRDFGRVFAILFEVLLTEIEEENDHFAGWEGGFKGHKNCEQKLCELSGVSYSCLMYKRDVDAPETACTQALLFWYP